MPLHNIESLPPSQDIETKRILKATSTANRYLAELKGMSQTIPNETILVSSLALQEAKDSSEVENIVTTNDELYKANLFEDLIDSSAAKEVRRYSGALLTGFVQVNDTKLLTTKNILAIHSELVKNSSGIRKLPGTTIKNATTGEVVYTPPQDHDEIVNLLSNLDKYINDDLASDVDPLIKMAVIHLQFESIHPFYDGNGRTGRIINILYLVAKGLLRIPVLYLSRYIIQNKSDYYKLLQQARATGDWEDWILYILAGVQENAKQTIQTIRKIKSVMMAYKQLIRGQLPKIYSQDLLNNLFCHPYTKIEYVQNDLGVSRITATKYLGQLCDKGLLVKRRIGRNNYYINEPLVQIFQNISEATN